MQKLIYSQIRRGTIAGCIGVLLLMSSTFIWAILMHSESISCDENAVITFLFLFFSSVTSGCITARDFKAGKWRSTLVAGGIILSCIVILTFSLSETINPLKGFINISAIAIGILLGCIICAKSTKKKRRKFAKYNHQ